MSWLPVIGVLGMRQTGKSTLVKALSQTNVGRATATEAELDRFLKTGLRGFELHNRAQFDLGPKKA